MMPRSTTQFPTAPSMATSYGDTRTLNLTMELGSRTGLAIEHLVAGADDSADSHLGALISFWICSLFECWAVGLDLVASYPILHHALVKVSAIWRGEGECWPSILLPPATPGPHDADRLLEALLVLDDVLNPNPPHPENTS